MATPLNTALLMLPKRAESTARENLISTFVDVGHLFTLLNTKDHQVLFGRRGTGKTHAFSFLAEQRAKKGDATVYLDLRSVGSNGGIYADSTIPLAERSTRLLVDTLAAIHDGLTNFCVEMAETVSLAETGPILDSLADAITQVRVVGVIEETGSEQEATEVKLSSTSGLTVGAKSLDITGSASSSEASNQSHSRSVKRTGSEQLNVNFGATGSGFRALVAKLKNRQVWILLDEWGSVPIVLQPFLADLLRRALLPVTGLTVKIAAIDHRSNFQIKGNSGDYVGIELGADVSADVNLDDFMVFDNDSSRAMDFFRDLIGRHVLAAVRGTDYVDRIPSAPDKVVADIFTEKRALEEFVRACEGVPRDAINILALAAQRADNEAISVSHIRVAARNWYQRDKERSVSADQSAHRLLNLIIGDVIGDRKARAFLLKSDARSNLIDALYDARVLHILKRGISTHDKPGERYDVYKLDYGCYVDLMATSRAPQGLLPLDVQKDGYVDVPPDDYRAIRRAIIHLELIDLNEGTKDLRAT